MHKVRLRQFLGRALRLVQARGPSAVATFIKIKWKTKFLGWAMWLGRLGGRVLRPHLSRWQSYSRYMWGYVRLRHLLCVRPTELSATNLEKMCTVQPTYSRSDTLTLHPTYQICASDLQNLCIRPTKVVHPTYIRVQPT